MLWALPEGVFVRCPMDLAANPSDVQGVTYEEKTANRERSGPSRCLAARRSRPAPCAPATVWQEATCPVAAAGVAGAVASSPTGIRTEKTVSGSLAPGLATAGLPSDSSTIIQGGAK